MPKENEQDSRLTRALLDKRRQYQVAMDEIDAVLTRMGVETGKAVVTTPKRRQPPKPKPVQTRGKTLEHMAAIVAVLEQADGPLLTPELYANGDFKVSEAQVYKVLARMEAEGTVRSWRTTESGTAKRWTLTSKLAGANSKEAAHAAA